MTREWPKLSLWVARSICLMLSVALAACAWTWPPQPEFRLAYSSVHLLGFIGDSHSLTALVRPEAPEQKPRLVSIDAETGSLLKETPLKGNDVAKVDHRSTGSLSQDGSTLVISGLTTTFLREVIDPETNSVHTVSETRVPPSIVLDVDTGQQRFPAIAEQDVEGESTLSSHGNYLLIRCRTLGILRLRVVNLRTGDYLTHDEILDADFGPDESLWVLKANAPNGFATVQHVELPSDRPLGEWVIPPPKGETWVKFEEPVCHQEDQIRLRTFEGKMSWTYEIQVQANERFGVPQRIKCPDYLTMGSQHHLTWRPIKNPKWIPAWNWIVNHAPVLQLETVPDNKFSIAVALADPQTGGPLHRFLDLGNDTRVVKLSPDARCLVTGDDCALTFWHLPPRNRWAETLLALIAPFAVWRTLVRLFHPR